MAHLHTEFTSILLNTQVSLEVILPTELDYRLLGRPLEELLSREPYPVLYFLHGAMSGPEQILRFTSIERYAEENRIAVVMPYAQNSFYRNMAHGGRYLDFMTKELPLMAHKLFPLSERPEDTYIGGFSMGGYGAMQIALTHPGQFAGVASLSGVLDLGGSVEVLRRGMGLPMELAFERPDALEGTEEDVLLLLRRAAAEHTVPPIYQAVGTEDFLYGANQNFRALAEELKLADFHYEECPGGHEWAFWDPQIQKVLAWIKNKRGGGAE